LFVNHLEHLEMETQTTTLFDEIGKLATRYLPNTASFSALVQARRQDLDALLSVGRITGNGVQTVAGKQVDTLRTLGEDLRSALTGQPEGEATKTEAVREAAQKAVNSYAELAGVAIDAQAEAFDTIKQRVYANLEELKSLLSRKP
jgi:Phasin protein